MTNTHINITPIIDTGVETYLPILADKIRSWLSVSTTNESLLKVSYLIMAKYDIKPNDQLGAARAIREFVASHIPYTNDPIDVERVISPIVIAEDILNNKYGNEDCDSKAIFCTALLRAVGIEATVVFLDSNSNGVINHAMTLAYIANNAYLLEAAYPGYEFGWYPKFTKLYIVNIPQNFSLQMVG